MDCWHYMQEETRALPAGRDEGDDDDLLLLQLRLTGKVDLHVGSVRRAARECVPHRRRHTSPAPEVGHLLNLQNNNNIRNTKKLLLDLIKSTTKSNTTSHGQVRLGLNTDI